MSSPSFKYLEEIYVVIVYGFPKQIVFRLSVLCHKQDKHMP